MSKTIIAAAVVGIVILVECALAYMFIPSTAQVASRLEEHSATESEHGAEDPHKHETAKEPDKHGADAKHGSHDKPAAKGHGDAHGKPAEPAKGGHGAPAAGGHGAPAAGGHGGGHGAAPAAKPIDPHSEIEMDIGKFNVVVHQPAANVTLRITFHLIGTAIGADNDELTELVKNNQHRLRDQVIFEIRNSDPAELTDPGLALIKRRILAKSNALIGKPMFRAMLFSEFSFIEQ